MEKVQSLSGCVGGQVIVSSQIFEHSLMMNVSMQKGDTFELITQTHDTVILTSDYDPFFAENAGLLSESALTIVKTNHDENSGDVLFSIFYHPNFDLGD